MMDWKGLGLVFLTLLIAGLSTLACKGQVKVDSVPTKTSDNAKVIVPDKAPEVYTGATCIDGHYCLIAQRDGLAMVCPFKPELDQTCEVLKVTMPNKKPEKVGAEQWPSQEK